MGNINAIFGIILSVKVSARGCIACPGHNDSEVYDLKPEWANKNSSGRADGRNEGKKAGKKRTGTRKQRRKNGTARRKKERKRAHTGYTSAGITEGRKKYVKWQKKIENGRK